MPPGSTKSYSVLDVAESASSEYAVFAYETPATPYLHLQRMLLRSF